MIEGKDLLSAFLANMRDKGICRGNLLLSQRRKKVGKLFTSKYLMGCLKNRTDIWDRYLMKLQQSFSVMSTKISELLIMTHY